MVSALLSPSKDSRNAPGKVKPHAARTILELVTATFGKEFLPLALPWGHFLILVEKRSFCASKTAVLELPLVSADHHNC